MGVTNSNHKACFRGTTSWQRQWGNFQGITEDVFETTCGFPFPLKGQGFKGLKPLKGQDCQWDGLISRGTFNQTWSPEFDSQALMVERQTWCLGFWTIEPFLRQENLWLPSTSTQHCMIRFWCEWQSKHSLHYRACESILMLRHLSPCCVVCSYFLQTEAFPPCKRLIRSSRE